MKRSQTLYLADIKSAIEAVIKFTDGMSFDDFKADDKTFSAVIRKIEIIGEAVKNLTDEIKETCADIPWSVMARMRDKLIHGYFGVDVAVVWKVVKTELPEILHLVKGLYEKYRDQ